MKSTYRKVNEHGLNKVNPFLDDTVQHIEKGEKTLLFGQKNPGLSNWFDLSKAGIKMFAYVANQVTPNKDTFDVDFDECKAFTGYKGTSTILSALAELMENKFIARGPNPYKYYINPTIFFNGDRLTFIEQYEVESKEENSVEIGKTAQESFNELAKTLA
jgi:hypothetical protein